MSLSDDRNRSVATGSVEPAGDDRPADRDKPVAGVTSGGWRGTKGALLSPYGWLALLILATATVNMLTAIQHGAGLSRPLLDEATSAVGLVAVLPILKRAVDAFAGTRDRRIAFIIVALAIVAYAALHVVLMVALREITYPMFGDHFDFRWREQLPGELRKDVISAFMIAVVFWL